MADSALQRWLWRVLERVSTLIGTRGARVVAALAMRAGARDRGYAKGLYRVASRRRVPMPDLWTVPEAWWSTAPRVSARRLGLRLHLDLRDNLQRTLSSRARTSPACCASSRTSCAPATRCSTSAPTSASTR